MFSAALFLYLPLYPSIGNDQMAAVLDSMPEELIKTLGYENLTSGAGYAQATIFGLIVFALLTIAATAWSSSAIAGAEGHEIGEEFDESDWSDPDRPNLNAYTKSKTLAERALWDWNKTEAPDAEVTAINPSFVMGPPLGTKSVPSSLNIIARLMQGTAPALPVVAIRKALRIVSGILRADLGITDAFVTG